MQLPQQPWPKLVRAQPPDGIPSGIALPVPAEVGLEQSRALARLGRRSIRVEPERPWRQQVADERGARAHDPVHGGDERAGGEGVAHRFEQQRVVHEGVGGVEGEGLGEGRHRLQQQREGSVADGAVGLGEAAVLLGVAVFPPGHLGDVARDAPDAHPHAHRAEELEERVGLPLAQRPPAVTVDPRDRLDHEEGEGKQVVVVGDLVVRVDEVEPAQG
mmetsp:Transcript_31384/g.58528  ORF Transcript_31384/g.58528 Transcript_31384/m.58528 type:complete len:217 (-) Transcript_31384:626-1276(-)